MQAAELIQCISNIATGATETPSDNEALNRIEALIQEYYASRTFKDDIHAIVNSHIPSGLQPERAAAVMTNAATLALEHLSWMPAEIRAAHGMLHQARQYLPEPLAQRTA